jgi:DNA-binding response OmpR family regulator
MVVKTRVLLINDDPIASQQWAGDLEQLGLEVVVSSPTPTTLYGIETGKFSLVIIAISASPSEGLILCQQSRLRTRKPILIFVGNDCEPLAVAAYRVGVDEYIASPVSSSLLLYKVTAWLRWAPPIPVL